jgi:hypothetical protein
MRQVFIYEKANANWIAGRLAEARSELEKLGCSATPQGFQENIDPDFEDEVKRLWNFLAIVPNS